MKQYIDLVTDILQNGNDRSDRTGVGTRGVFGRQLRFDLRDGFPLITTKKMFTRGIIAELIWFISGSTNEHVLRDQNVNIWKEWANEDGSLGPVYGEQWRRCCGVNGLGQVIRIDQLQQAIDTIRTNACSRRIIVDSWNVTQIDAMALPPCHCLYQFYVEDDWLDLQLYQRSCDVGLGLCFNVAQYSMLLSLVAKITNKKPRYFIHTFGDVHIYSNHIDALTEQIKRTPYDLPRLVLRDRGQKEIDDFVSDDIIIENYVSHPAIKLEVAV